MAGGGSSACESSVSRSSERLETISGSSKAPTRSDKQLGRARSNPARLSAAWKGTEVDADGAVRLEGVADVEEEEGRLHHVHLEVAAASPTRARGGEGIAYIFF